MTLISSQKPRNSSKNSQIKLTEVANGMASRSMVRKQRPNMQDIDMRNIQFDEGWSWCKTESNGDV